MRAERTGVGAQPEPAYAQIEGGSRRPQASAEQGDAGARRARRHARAASACAQGPSMATARPGRVERWSGEGVAAGSGRGSAVSARACARTAPTMEGKERRSGPHCEAQGRGSGG